MTTVYCDYTNCEHCSKGICQREIIYACDGCEQWVDHVEVSEEYKNVYWLHCQDKNKKEYRKKALGKRYEILGLVWYTKEDDRDGIKDIIFTEEKSGVACQGKFITKERLETIKETIEKVKPVMDLPEYQE